MKKLFVTHNSCLNASYDLNVIKEGLRRKGYALTDQPDDADEVIFSGCGAHQTWVDDAIRQINRISATRPHAKVTVTGCVAGIDAARVRENVQTGELAFMKQEAVLAAYTGLDFNELDREYTQDRSLEFEGNNGLSQIRTRVGKEKARVVAELDKIDRELGTDLMQSYKKTTKGFVFYHEDGQVEFVTVSRSCLYKCAFCAIPRGRGAYTSVPLSSILDKVRGALARGIKRVTLIGDEVGNYGVDIEGGPRLRDLIESILALDDGLTLSIRYVEPTPFVRNYDVFKRRCSEGRIDLLYVPLQTGSQRVLKQMNRNYDLRSVGDKYRELRRDSDTVFFCNWMVGFPGETEADFEQTIDLARHLDLQINSAIPFSERPNTPAPLMPDKVSEATKKERLDTLRDVLCDMKLGLFRHKMTAVAPSRAEEVLGYMRAAELVHVDDFSTQPLRLPVVR